MNEHPNTDDRDCRIVSTWDQCVWRPLAITSRAEFKAWKRAVEHLRRDEQTIREFEARYAKIKKMWKLP
jgi:hypothetical protein